MFRTHNEKHYKDKELRELRKKEIREPLEEAYTVIEVFKGKVARRDDMIHKLQKYISIDMLKSNQASFEETKTKVIEFNQVEEHNQMVLMDSVSELEKAAEHQAAKIDRHKTTITQQKDKIRSLSAALETQDFSHKEQIRTYESDKIFNLNMLECKENIVLSLNSEKDAQKARIDTLEKDLAETQMRLQYSQERVQQQAKLLTEAEAEYQSLHKKYAATEDSFLQCQDTLVELEERFGNLRTRYHCDFLSAHLLNFRLIILIQPHTIQIRSAGGGAGRDGGGRVHHSFRGGAAGEQSAHCRDFSTMLLIRSRHTGCEARQTRPDEATGLGEADQGPQRQVRQGEDLDGRLVQPQCRQQQCRWGWKLREREYYRGGLHNYQQHRCYPQHQHRQQHCHLHCFQLSHGCSGAGVCRKHFRKRLHKSQRQPVQRAHAPGGRVLRPEPPRGTRRTERRW